MRQRYWKCSGCGETLQGIKDSEGEFISDKELERPRQFRAIGCYVCGCVVGEFGEEVPEEYDEEADHA